MGPKANVTYAHITAATAHSLLRGEAAYSELQATEIYLDAYSTNRYISGDFSALTDALAVATTKLSIDSFGLTESQVIALAKEASDSFGFVETVGIFLEIVRDFSDSIGTTDASVLVFDKGAVDALTFSDSRAAVLESSKTDGVTLGEVEAKQLNKAATDSSSITDLFGRAVVFARHFTDAFALDEAVLINPDIGVNKSNIFSFTDTFSYQMVIGNNSVLNSSALNTYTLSS